MVRWLHRKPSIMQALAVAANPWVELLCEDGEVYTTKCYAHLVLLSGSLREFSPDLRRGVTHCFPQSAKWIYPKIVPSCIAQRWAEIVTFEKYLVARPWGLFPRVVSSLFGKEADIGTTIHGREPVEEESVHERSAYSKKIGRWRKTALLITSPKRFRVMLEATHKAHKEISHLQSDLTSVEHRCGTLLFMVWSGDDKYLNIFRRMALRDDWIDLKGRAKIANIHFFFRWIDSFPQLHCSCELRT